MIESVLFVYVTITILCANQFSYPIPPNITSDERAVGFGKSCHLDQWWNDQWWNDQWWNDQWWDDQWWNYQRWNDQWWNDQWWNDQWWANTYWFCKLVSLKVAGFHPMKYLHGVFAIAIKTHETSGPGIWPIVADRALIAKAFLYGENSLLYKFLCQHEFQDFLAIFFNLIYVLWP